jgi:hypothetical protein
MGTPEGFERQLKKVELDEGEFYVEAWVGGIPLGKGNGTKVGGSLVLTNQRLMFVPLKLPVGYEIRRSQRWIDDYGFNLDIVSVTDVRVDESRRSALQMRSRQGTMFLNLAASRRSFVFSKKNPPVRDEAVAVISSALTSSDDA